MPQQGSSRRPTAAAAAAAATLLAVVCCSIGPLCSSAAFAESSAGASECSIVLVGLGSVGNETTASRPTASLRCRGGAAPVGVLASPELRSRLEAGAGATGVRWITDPAACGVQAADAPCMLTFCDGADVTWRSPTVRSVALQLGGGGGGGGGGGADEPRRLTGSVLCVVGPRAQVRVAGGEFVGNTGLTHAVVSVRRGARAVFSGALFARNRAANADAGAALSLLEGAHARVERCQFDANFCGVVDTPKGITPYALSSGGGAYVSESALEVVDSEFVRGIAWFGAGVYACGAAARVAITRSRFARNWVSDYGGAIYLYSGARVVADGLTCEGNEAEWGGCIYSELNVTAVLTDSVLRGNAATYAGGGIYMYDSSRLTGRNVTFIENESRIDGGGLSVEQNSALSLTRCALLSNAARNAGGGFVLRNSTATVVDTAIEGNAAARGGGVAVSAQKGVPRLNLTRCRIAGNTAVVGGALNLDGGATVLTACEVDGNAARDGGAIAFASCEFAAPRRRPPPAALAASGSAAANDLGGAGPGAGGGVGIFGGGGGGGDKDGGFGGVGFKGDVRTAPCASSLALRGGTRVRGNRAQLSGGGFLFESLGGAVIDLAGVFQAAANNSAFLGAQVSLRPTALVLLRGGGHGDEGAAAAACAAAAAAAADGAAHHAAAPAIAVGEVVNRVGRAADADADSLLPLRIVACGPQALPVSGVRIAVRAAAAAAGGGGGSSIRPGTAAAAAAAQLLAVTDGEGFTDAGGVANLRVRLQGPPREWPLTAVASDFPTLPALRLRVRLRACSPGEVTVGDACVACGPGSFSLNPSNLSCDGCLEGARCPGGDRLLPLPGWWRSSGRSTQIHSCVNHAACPGGDGGGGGGGGDTALALAAASPCAAGYEGPLCGACAAGYGMLGGSQASFTCVACGSRGHAALLAIVLFAVQLLFASLSAASWCRHGQRLSRSAAAVVVATATTTTAPAAAAAPPFSPPSHGGNGAGATANAAAAGDDDGSGTIAAVRGTAAAAAGTGAPAPKPPLPPPPPLSAAYNELDKPADASAALVSELMLQLLPYLQYLANLLLACGARVALPAFLLPPAGAIGVVSGFGLRFMSADCLLQERFAPLMAHARALAAFVMPIAQFAVIALAVAAFPCARAAAARWRQRRRQAAAARAAAAAATAAASSSSETQQGRLGDVLAVAAAACFLVAAPSLVRASLSAFSCLQVDSSGGGGSTAAALAVGAFWSPDLRQRCWQGPHLLWALTWGVLGTAVFAVAPPLAAYLLLRRGARTGRLARADVLRRFGFFYSPFLPRFAAAWPAANLARTVLVVALGVFSLSMSPFAFFTAAALLFAAEAAALMALRPYALREVQRAAALCAAALALTALLLLPVASSPLQHDAPSHQAHALQRVVFCALALALNAAVAARLGYLICRHALLAASPLLRERAARLWSACCCCCGRRSSGGGGGCLPSRRPRNAVAKAPPPQGSASSSSSSTAAALSAPSPSAGSQNEPSSSSPLPDLSASSSTSSTAAAAAPASHQAPAPHQAPAAQAPAHQAPALR